MNSLSSLLLCTGALFALTEGVDARISPTSEPDDDARLEQLENKVDILMEEIERMRIADVSSVLGESYSGLGQAASRVFGSESGLSIGGYGEMIYQNFRSSGKTDQADFLRAILYVGYKFDDHWVLNTEIEIEHTEEISLEFATLDYLNTALLNFRVGLLLIPMGFTNELHEPTTFNSVRRSDIESFIIPSTWRENGVGIYGESEDFSYRLYAVNGFDGQAFKATNGLRGGRQKGGKAKADDFAGVARLDWTGIPGVLLGGSYYVGHSGQDLDGSNGKVSIMEAHAEWKYRGAHLRALWAEAEVGDVAAMATASGLGATEAIGENLQGGYVEFGYDVLSGRVEEASVTPFVRWESYDLQRDTPMGFTATGSQDVRVTTVGVSWQPSVHLIFKADFQNYNTRAHDGVNQFNLGMGYIF